jgi:hypothetical protein
VAFSRCVPDCSDQSLDVAVVEIGGRVEEIDGDAAGEAVPVDGGHCGAATGAVLNEAAGEVSAAEERARIPKVSYLTLSEDIVRTLSVAFAKRLAAPVFLRLFREHPLFRTDASAYEEYARGLLLGASYRQFGGQQTCGCAWPARRSRATLYWHRAGGRCW